MTLAVTKTKAEQALSHNFEAVAAKLPGGRAVAEARKVAIGVFAALGLPHRRIEEWKYTDLRSSLKEVLAPSVRDAVKAAAGEIDAALGSLADIDCHRVVFIDGLHAPELSGGAWPAGIEVATLASTLTAAGDQDGESLVVPKAPGQDAVIALNTAFMTDGAIVSVGQGVALDKPVLLVFARAAREGRLVTTRNAIRIAEGARATVIEAHVTLADAAHGQANTLSEVAVADGAELVHVKCVLAGETSTHLATWLVTLGRQAAYRAFQLTAATGLTRNNLLATFRGEGAKLDVSGSFLGRGTEHIDTTLVVDHAVPGCESRELFKGVLADRARGVFQGKVIVRPDAQKSDGKQMAQVLMLSQDAEFELQARARDPRRRRGLRPRLDRCRDRRGPALLHALTRHPAGGSARPADREFHRRGDRQDRGRALARRPGRARQAAARQALGDMSLNAARAA